MNTLIDFVGRHYVHIALIVGCVVAVYEHVKFNRERNGGKWGF